MRKRPQIGDIVEIQTPIGLAYVQYAKFDMDGLGEMIRVLPGIYPDRPETFADLAQGEERFITFLTLGWLVRRGDVTIVGNEPVPAYAGAITTVRMPGERERLPEEESLSINFGIMGLGSLVEAMCSAWLPEHAGGILIGAAGRSPREQDRAILRMLRSAGSVMSLPHEITHKLFYSWTNASKRDNTQTLAEQAAVALKREGFDVELEKDVNGWWLFAVHEAVPTQKNMENIRRRMIAFAAETDGGYAGWLPKTNRHRPSKK